MIGIDFPFVTLLEAGPCCLRYKGRAADAEKISHSLGG